MILMKSQNFSKIWKPQHRWSNVNSGSKRVILGSKKDRKKRWLISRAVWRRSNWKSRKKNEFVNKHGNYLVNEGNVKINPINSTGLIASKNQKLKVLSLQLAKIVKHSDYLPTTISNRQFSNLWGDKKTLKIQKIRNLN